MSSRGEAGLAREPDALGTHRQHRLGTLVDGEALQLAHAQLAAELGRGLEHGDLDVVAHPGERPRGRKPGDAASDHDHVRPPGSRHHLSVAHASTLPLRPEAPRAGGPSVATRS